MVCLKGETGDTGPTGNPGNKGPPGDQGPQGPPVSDYFLVEYLPDKIARQTKKYMEVIKILCLTTEVLFYQIVLF